MTGRTAHTVGRWIKKGLVHVWVLPSGRCLICERSIIGQGRGRARPSPERSHIVGEKPKDQHLRP